MTASPALWPITGPEAPNLSEPRHDPPRERRFLERLQRPSVGIRGRADKQFALLKANPQHPSLQFKKIGERRGEEIWSARITLKYRALAVRLADGYVWFWLGEHNAYDAIIS